MYVLIALVYKKNRLSKMRANTINLIQVYLIGIHIVNKGVSIVNVYEKLQEARVKLQEMNLKKSGVNNYANYTYYELSDFLPQINTLNKDHKLFSQVTFNNDSATLTIINTEKPEEKVEFNSPMRDLELKGCNQIQALGGIETYQRRYLYMMAYEIVENDMFDGKADEKENGSQTSKMAPNLKDDTKGRQVISEAQIKRMFALSKGNTAIILDVCTKYGYKKDKDIKQIDYDKICKEIEARVKEDAEFIAQMQGEKS